MNLQARLNELKQKASQHQHIENWKPLAGDMIAGELMGWNKFVHRVYGDQIAMLLMDEAGAVTSVLLNTYLKIGLKAHDVKVGDLVCVTFIGKGTSKAGNPYNQYLLTVEK